MTRKPARAPGAVRMWGGVECTINRVGDYWNDQDRSNRHSERGVADLELFEELGLEMVRYPVLWETIAPDSLDEHRFEFSDERMEFLRDSALEPIVGLLHHGSGPDYTSLIDPDFPQKLAVYAGHVAERYPWANYYTPVNEPLTTARFSGLYGAWFPHGRDDATFARTLYSQVRGTVQAMDAIRRVNPRARLVQTDDLGRTTGTEITRHQVDFENERRWLTFDLLTGKVTPEHALHGYLVREGGLGEAELAWLVANPCPPDVIGVNHYLLSNRFLDHELEWYPEHTVARANSSCPVPYADVPALESGRADSPSVGSLLRDVAERYPHTPFAVTEVHIDGDPHTRLRWLWEVWNAATSLHDDGARILAVTVWSLLGTYDWNTLCTTGEGGDLYYEPGVFDVSAGIPEPTELAAMVHALAHTGDFDHPALASNGFWRERERFRFALDVTGELAS